MVGMRQVCLVGELLAVACQEERPCLEQPYREVVLKEKLVRLVLIEVHFDSPIPGGAPGIAP